jgi:hypothetical protein
MGRLVDLPPLDGAHAFALRRTDVLVVMLEHPTTLAELDSYRRRLPYDLRDRVVFLYGAQFAVLEDGAPHLAEANDGDPGPPAATG